MVERGDRPGANVALSIVPAAPFVVLHASQSDIAEAVRLTPTRASTHTAAAAG